MKSQLLTLLLVACAATLPANAAESAKKTLDVSAITAISIIGDASSVHITTGEAPYQASLGSRRSGWLTQWYSSWFFSDCRNAGEMRIEGTTLYVNVFAPSWIDLSDCVADISANVPKDSAVSIDHAALEANLAGEFGAVRIASKAADVSLDGRAESVDLKGEAVQARLDFANLRQDGTIDIDAKALDVYLGFGKGVPISYSVTAGAALVDSAVVNTPGAKPEVRIKGDFVRATIR